MKNFINFLNIKNLIISALLTIIFLKPVYSKETEKIEFWREQKKGANIFNNNPPSRETIKKAKEYGLQFIRLSVDKFPSESRDFLVGNADDYKNLNSKDLQTLKDLLDIFTKENLPVVLTFLSLPGSRWKQNNQDKDDLRLWKKEKFRKQAASFWHDIAVALKDYNIIIGYNILNEPHPERLINPKGDFSCSHYQGKNIALKLYSFYDQVIRSIRTADKETPIILDSLMYADPACFNILLPFEDSTILYSFHMYEPFHYTNYKLNKMKYVYPGKIPYNDENKMWNITALEEYLTPVTEFLQKYNIDNNRIIVGEFGGSRRVKGIERYFEDLISIFNKNKWHHAFYAFREDGWPDWDYEIGDTSISWQDMKKMEKGEMKYPYNPNNKIFKVLVH